MMADKKRDLSQMYADKLGKDQQDKGTKGWDGKDLKDSDARLYGLRESGYDGPIDQDGYMGGTWKW